MPDVSDANSGPDSGPDSGPAADLDRGRDGDRGVGVEFAPAADVDAPVAPAPHERTPAHARVLLAEDEAIIRLDLKEMLEEEGYEVVAECANGDDAIRLAHELRPDLAILDIKMPGADGLTAARDIVANRLSAVLILTAFSQRELVKSAREAGAYAYIVKPFQKNDLLPAIEVALGRFQEMQALEGEIADLTERLEARKVIDRAKGKVMDAMGLSENEAFRLIQQRAMQSRLTMRKVAEAIVAGELEP